MEMIATSAKGVAITQFFGVWTLLEEQIQPK